MNKNAATFQLDNFNDFKIRMLNWANQFNIFCLLDNQQYKFSNPSFECLVAVGSKKNFTAQAGSTFEGLKHFATENKGWVFGHLGYDLKNEIEQLTSNNYDGIGFDDTHFFVPEIVIELSHTTASIFCDSNAKDIYETILSQNNFIDESATTTPQVQNRFTKADYINTVKELQQHILRGNCYEINFCQEFFAEKAIINPLQVYQQLIQLSPNPFAALYKCHDKYCICASPERYLKKTGNTIISQPIKGTTKRDLLNAQIDEEQKKYLSSNQKEKSENVMVVDLVRNDLSKICEQGSVKVEELFGVYSFPQVHQMISTISGELNGDTNWVDIIKATFPMGSMTGAPKKRVMQLIEEYEKTKRGLFSGSIGYVNPQGDFDFNVIIRSILYNHTNQYLSFQAGGGITFYSDAEKEYEESLLKAESMKKVLEEK